MYPPYPWYCELDGESKRPYERETAIVNREDPFSLDLYIEGSWLDTNGDTTGGRGGGGGRGSFSLLRITFLRWRPPSVRPPCGDYEPDGRKKGEGGEVGKAPTALLRGGRGPRASSSALPQRLLLLLLLLLLLAATLFSGP